MSEGHRRIDAAVTQLHFAIELYLDGREYLSAITLASAAEGMLGEWLAGNQQDNALRQLSPIVGKLTKKMLGREWTPKEISDDLNLTRNWLKHFREPDTLEIDAREEAYAMIDRAVINFRVLTGGYTDSMLRFLEAERVGGELMVKRQSVADRAHDNGPASDSLAVGRWSDFWSQIWHRV